MTHKEQVENFLRLNDIAHDAPDEEIRSALNAARWHARDIEHALMLLRGMDMEESALRSRGHDLLNSYQKVSPETLSSLLGVPVRVRKELDHPEHCRSGDDRHTFSDTFTWILIVILSSLIAASLGAYGMYAYGVGPFYSPL